MSGYFKTILEWIFGLVGNYGWSVVLFTLVVRMALLPLDIRSKKSMRAMNLIQPKVQALQKKYANDKEKLNVKMNELYRKEHVNPLSGCLPMLISLPILLWMFAAMRQLANEHTISMILQIKENLDNGMSAEECAEIVRGSLQSWLWIKNVFQPDSFSATILPKVGDTLQMVGAVKNSAILTDLNLTAAREFLATDAYASVAAQFGTEGFKSIQLTLLIINPTIAIPSSWANLINNANGLFILPVLSGASQFLMSAVTNTQQAMEAGSNNKSGMNGFMKWFFPLFSLYICAGYNAAFAIYWMAANVIQILQQYAVNFYFDRQDKKKAEANDLKET